MSDDGRYRPQFEPSDEALVARVAQRDAAALATLYDRYAQPVYALAAHTLGQADAEEVVQEVFLSLWQKAAQFDRKRGWFYVWFLTIARHRVLDELRRRGHRERMVAAEAVDRLLAEAPDAAADVDEQVWLRDRGRAALQALRALPANQRRALVLAYFGGLSQSAIARQLGWPLGTVKKRIRLGLQKLRAAVEREPAGETVPSAARMEVR